MPGQASPGAPLPAWPPCGHPHCHVPLPATHPPGCGCPMVSEPPSSHLCEGLALPRPLWWPTVCWPSLGQRQGHQGEQMDKPHPMEHRLKGPPPRHWPVLPHWPSQPGLACVGYLCGPTSGEQANRHGECTCNEQLFIQVWNLKGKSNQFRSGETGNRGLSVSLLGSELHKGAGPGGVQGACTCQAQLSVHWLRECP